MRAETPRSRECDARMNFFIYGNPVLSIMCDQLYTDLSSQPPICFNKYFLNRVYKIFNRLVYIYIYTLSHIKFSLPLGT